MASSTKLFLMQPWVGGVNSSEDPSVIKPNELTVAENLFFGVRGSRGKRDGIAFNWDSATTGTENIIGGIDFWFGPIPKTQKIITVGDSKSVYSYSTGGTRSTLTDSGTAWSSAITQASCEVMNNLVLVAVDGSGNVLKKWSGTGNMNDLGVNTATANTHTNTTIDNLSTLVGVIIGAAVIGSGVAPNTIVTGITSGTAITVNNATTTSLTGTPLTFTVTPPKASILREHKGRMFSNDKNNPDRLYYTSPGNAEEWGGLGDSGAIDIGVGDGDPAGITAIFPTFQGVLFIGKQTKLYRMDGTTPDNFQITLVSDGIGCISHNSIAAFDQEDIFFMSEKGYHSLAATLNYGDVQEQYASYPIQATFNTKWTRSRLKYSFGGYLSHINSIAVAVTDESYSQGANNALWLYNIPLKSWYTWPNISCQSLLVASDSDKRRFYLGGNTSRVAKTFVGTNYDTSSAGTQMPILMNIKTGLIYFNDNPYVINGYKKFILIYGPKGTHTITASLQIDNYSPQALAYTLTGSSKLLGVDFVLGVSTLGYTATTGPYTQSFDGYGRGIQLTITQSGINEQAEIQGFGIEYEPMGTMQETITSENG